MERHAGGPQGPVPPGRAPAGTGHLGPSRTAHSRPCVLDEASRVEEPAGIDPLILARLTAAAFGQRRKMLRQSLKGMPGALDALATIGIDPSRRAETVAVSDFVALARVLTAR